MRYLLLVLISLNILNAAYLWKEKNMCIDYYYFKDTNLYYKPSDSDDEYSTYRTNQTFLPGYEYNSSNNHCQIPSYIQELSIQPDEYNFLLALSGVLAGFTFLFFSIYIFVDIVKKERR